MIDLGADDPQVAQMLNRALAVVDGPINDLTAQLSTMEDLDASSEMQRLRDEIPADPLDIVAALFTALYAARGSLEHISYIVTHPVPTRPIVLQSLLRTALTASARAVYVLLPSEPGIRQDRAAAILAQDSASGVKALQHYTKFEGLAGVRAPEKLLTEFQNQRAALLKQQPQARDGSVVDGMIESIIEALIAADVDEEFGPAILRDHARWLWNTYSGTAHAYSWPRSMWTVSGDRRIPGDFPMDLHQTATCLHIALVAALARLAPRSAGSTKTVSLRR